MCFLSREEGEEEERYVIGSQKFMKKGRLGFFIFVLAILKFLISHLDTKYKEFVVTRHLLLFGN